MKSALQLLIDGWIAEVRDEPGYCESCGSELIPGDIYRREWDKSTGDPILYRYYFCPKVRWWHMISGGHRVVPVRERVTKVMVPGDAST